MCQRVLTFLQGTGTPPPSPPLSSRRTYPFPWHVPPRPSGLHDTPPLARPPLLPRARSRSERDPACDSYHDCLLYFKGFQALQTHRVAHWLYHTGRHALAFYLQSQVT